MELLSLEYIVCINLTILNYFLSYFYVNYSCATNLEIVSMKESDILLMDMAMSTLLFMLIKSIYSLRSSACSTCASVLSAA